MQYIAFRLVAGQLLKEEIELRTKHVHAGVLFSVVGALENANLRMAGATTDNQVVVNLRGPFEIVSGTGTVSPDGCHIHIAVADADGKVRGGHLKDGCRVSVTAEIVIGIIQETSFTRAIDPATGFQELNIT